MSIAKVVFAGKHGKKDEKKIVDQYSKREKRRKLKLLLANVFHGESVCRLC